MPKLQNFFNDFLPLNYRDFRQSIFSMTSNQAVVAELLRICCEDDEVKAIKMAFERILGKPEKALVIKQTKMRVEYPEATGKLPQPADTTPTEVIDITRGKVVVAEKDTPGYALQQMLDKVGEAGNQYAYDVLESKDKHSVVEVMVCNLYAIAMRGGNLAAIDLLFEYLDGSIADVIRVEGSDTVLIENYAESAPYEAKQDENGVWYVEKEVVK